MRLTSVLFATLLALGVAQAGWFGDGLGDGVGDGLGDRLGDGVGNGLSDRISLRDDSRNPFSGINDFFSGIGDWIIGFTGPSFLKSVNRQGRQDYDKIMKNKTLTRAQIETAVTNWAQTYNVTAQVNAYNAKEQSEKAQLRSNVTSAVQELPKLISQLNAIEDNQNLTPDQASQQIRAAMRNATQPFLRDLIMDVVPPATALGSIFGGVAKDDVFERK